MPSRALGAKGVASFTGSATAARGSDCAQYTSLFLQLMSGLNTAARRADQRRLAPSRNGPQLLVGSCPAPRCRSRAMILKAASWESAKPRRIGVCAGSDRLSKSLPCQGVLPAVVGWRSLRRLDLLLSRNGAARTATDRKRSSPVFGQRRSCLLASARRRYQHPLGVPHDACAIVE